MLKKHYRPLKLLFLRGLLVPCILMITSCSDDGDDAPAVDPLVGKHFISSAKLSNAVAGIPAGTDVTQYIGAALFAASPCGTEDGRNLIEIEKDKTFDLTCGLDDSKSADGGSWEVSDDRSEFKLSLLRTQQGQTVTLPITLRNLKESSTTISGDILQLSIPVANFGDLLNSNEANVVLDLSMEFTRVL